MTGSKSAARDNVSLREYVETRFDHLRMQVDLTFGLHKVALDKAEALTNERLSKMNKFREMLNDQALTFITRTEMVGLLARMEVEMKVMEAEIRVLREYKVQLDAKASANSVYFGYIIAGAGLVLSVVGVVLSLR